MNHLRICEKFQGKHLHKNMMDPSVSVEKQLHRYALSFDLDVGRIARIWIFSSPIVVCWKVNGKDSSS